jgi:hypothetical protein
MTPTIYLEPRDVPPMLSAGYSGKKYQARVCETVTIPADAGLWSEGSRDKYRAVRTVDGREIPMHDQSAPWSATRAEKRFDLAPGIVVALSRISRGVDMGLTFYLHPADAIKMLPAAVELDPTEKLVLEYTIGRKSSYNGMDRFQMAARDHHGELFPTRAAWDDAKARLIGRGLLNKAGAVTTAGRNASPGFI